jgi:MFS family permease
VHVVQPIGDAGARHWRRAVLVLFAVAAGTNVPTPLLLVYKDTLHLSATTLTALFGFYAAGLVPSLLVAGPLSDRVGRRAVVLPFVALSAVASLLFVVAAHSVVLLFAARFLQGVVSGAVFSVGSAWIGELSAGDGSGARRAAAAMSAGFSLGPLMSGLLGQYAPAPTTLPYLVHVTLVGVGALATRGLPETVTHHRHRVEHVREPLVRKGEGWRVLTVLAPLAVCVYAFPSVIISALPVLVDLPDGKGVVITGVLAGLTLGASTLAAPLQKRLRRWTPAVAAASGSVGYALALVAAREDAVALLVPGAVLLGAGGGLALASGLALVADLAMPSRRGALSSVFYACAYVGFAAPFATAVLAREHGASLPLALASALAALLSLRLLVRRLRTAPAEPVPDLTKGRDRVGPAPSS